MTSLRFLSSGSTHQLLAAGDPFGEPLELRTSARVLEVTTGADVAILASADHGIPVVACADEHDVFALGSNHLVRWEPVSGETVTSTSPLAPGPGTFFEVAKHRDERLLFVDNYGEPLVLDARTLQRRGRPYAARDALSAVAVRDGGGPAEAAVLATGDLEGDVRVWSVDELLGIGERTLARVVRGCVDAQSRFVTCVLDHPPPRLEVREVATGKLVNSEELLPAALCALSEDPGGLLLAYDTGLVERRSLPDLRVLWSATIHTAGVNDLTVWDDLVLSVGWDHALRISRISDGSAVRGPVHIAGWDDKGLLRVLVTTASDGVTPVVAAGPVYPGFAAWSLDQLLRNDEDSDFGSQWVRAPEYPSWGQSALIGGRSVLVVHTDSREELRLLQLAPDGSTVMSRSWRPHDHEVTALVQTTGAIWTSDSWGNVRCWANPIDVADHPTPLLDVRLRRHVVDIYPCGPRSVIVATESGLVRLDRHDLADLV